MQRIEVSDVHDQRVIGRPALRGIHAGKCGRIVCARTEAVHRLGGQHRKVTLRQCRGRNEWVSDEVHLAIHPCQRRGTVTWKALVLTALVDEANRTR